MDGGEDDVLIGIGTFGWGKVNVDEGGSRELALWLNSEAGFSRPGLGWLLLTVGSVQDFVEDTGFVVKVEFEDRGS